MASLPSVVRSQQLHLRKNQTRQLLTAPRLPTIVLWDGAKREFGTSSPFASPNYSCGLPGSCPPVFVQPVSCSHPLFKRSECSPSPELPCHGGLLRIAAF